MPNIVSIKFNEEESDLLRRAHAASGTAGLSSHIKQVYFDALKVNTGVLQDIHADLDRIGAGLQRLEGTEGSRDDGLLLSVVCGVYLMVRKSVGESIRSQADQLLNAQSLEAYLRGK
jgi:hypothetical protein